MFKHFKNIDTAFKHIRLFSLLFLLGNIIIVCYCFYQNKQLIEETQNKVLILYNGKVIQAAISDRKTNLSVELRDHIKTFHECFFELTPDDKAIKEHISEALFLADESAARLYEDLKESGYYNRLISANIVQQLATDSIVLNTDHYPYQFVYYGTQKLERSSNTLFRKLITRGRVRSLTDRTENNPHGFLIQNWQILENQNVK